MKKILFLLVTVVGWGLGSNAQKLSDHILRDTNVYVYKLSNEELVWIYKEEKINDDYAYFDNCFKVIHKDTNVWKNLPCGNFIKASIEGFKVTYELLEHTELNFRYAKYKNELIVYVFHDSIGQIAGDAEVKFNNTKLSYDSGVGGFVYDIKKGFKGGDSNLITCSYNNEFMVSTFNEIAPEKIPNPKYYNKQFQYGYLITDKPKYRIGDTLHMKSYLWDSRKGRPIRKKVSVAIKQGDKTFWTKSIKRKHAGAYVLDYVLPDSLLLDKEYNFTSL
jgi:alpha-2-macroglobulin